MSRPILPLSKAKKVERTRKWREANPCKVKAAMDQWHRDNKHKEKEYALAHPEMSRTSSKKYRENHPEKIKEANKKAWLNCDKEKVKKSKKIWRDSHPGHATARCQRRRALKVGATVEKFPLNEIYERDGWICQLCNKKVDRELEWPNGMSKSIDHIIPLIKGGEHSRRNVQLAHLVCNTSIRENGIKQMRLF
jgi:hypothetical protein